LLHNGEVFSANISSVSHTPALQAKQKAPVGFPPCPASDRVAVHIAKPHYEEIASVEIKDLAVSLDRAIDACVKFEAS
jgi:hypothetical protein